MMPPLTIANNLAAQCVPWRMVKIEGNPYKQIIAQVRGAWLLVPDDVTSVSAWLREIQS